MAKWVKSCRMERKLIRLVRPAALCSSALNLTYKLLPLFGGKLKAHWKYFPSCMFVWNCSEVLLLFLKATICLKYYSVNLLVKLQQGFEAVLHYIPSCFPVLTIRPGNISLVPALPAIIYLNFYLSLLRFLLFKTSNIWMVIPASRHV